MSDEQIERGLRAVMKELGFGMDCPHFGELNREDLPRLVELFQKAAKADE